MKTNNLRNLSLETSNDPQSYWGLLCEIFYGLNDSHRIIEIQNFYMDNLAEILDKNDSNESSNQNARNDSNFDLNGSILIQNQMNINISFNEWKNLKEAFVSGNSIFIQSHDTCVL